MYKLPNGKIVYQQDIQCVHQPTNGKGGIYVGNLQAAQNLQTLKKNNIKAILTAAKGVFLNHSKSEIPYQLYIPGQDHQKFDISKFFNQSITFIKDALQTTNILVHCLAGVSRSVSLVMAYFIKYHNMSYDSVYTKIKSKRSIIHPNDGFINQLRIFESECRDKGHTSSRNDNFQVRSSYSPSKRYERKDFQGYQASPQKFYQSPEKRYTRNQEDYRYTNYEKDSKVNQSLIANMRNPQLYKSIAQQTKKQRNYIDVDQSHQYSPERYQVRQNRVSSQVGLKRLSSMNVDLERPSENYKRNQVYNKYQNIEQRNRISSGYKPLDSIQNRDIQINSQIDRKILQIRKKYQQYTKVPLQKQRIPKYNHMKSVQQINQNSMDLKQVKMTKLSSDYQRSNIYLPRNNYIQDVNSSKYVGSRMRRMQSYQV